MARAVPSRAQACCGGGNAVIPTRLPPHERALVGVSLEARPFYATWGPTGAVRDVGALDLGMTAEPYAAVRVLPPWQLAVAVPLRMNVRSGAGADLRAGGGAGDVRVTSRWDVLYTRDGRVAPGLAVLGGVELPTGRSPEDATEPLATDATGTGATRLSGGVGVEQASGPWLVGATALALFSVPRAVRELRALAGPELDASAFATHVWRSGAAVATSLVFRWSAAPRVEGRAADDASVRSLGLQVSALLPVGETVRFTAGLFGELPIPGVGANAPIGVRLVLGVQRGFVAQ